ncbi:MAG: phosphatidylinositol mannoside acyltransferase [Acidimicrobiia bacterium]|nr:phosphatidylinositol mannoside acyltransferase [Acidimicrobiia bacterium]
MIEPTFKKAQSVRQRLSDKTTLLGYKAGGKVAATLPGPVAHLGGRQLSGLASRLMRGRTETVSRHMRRVHGPQLTGPALRRVVREVFDNYARYWVESFRIRNETPQSVLSRVTLDGWDNWDAATGSGRGVILALPHLGNWELAGAWVAANGHRIVAVAEALEPPELFEWFVQFREDLGMEVVGVGPQAKDAAIDVLLGGGVLALVSDRDINGAGVRVNFFGEDTTIPVGPALLALKTGAVLLPIGTFYTEGGGVHCLVRPPLDTESTGDTRADVARISQALAHEFEAIIRIAPQQWHLLQPNWPSDYSDEERPEHLRFEDDGLLDG